LFLAPLFAVSVGVVGISRLAQFGPDIAREYRYVADALPLFVLAAALAFGTPAVRAPAIRQIAPRPSPRRLALAGPLVVAYLAVFAVSAWPLANQWRGNPTKAYVTNMRHDLRSLAATSSDWAVYDTTVPVELMPADWYPYTKVSRFDPLAQHGVRFNGPASRMFRIAPDGHVVPAGFDALTGAPPACAPATDTQLLVTLDHPLARGHWFLLVDTVAPAPVPVHLALTPAPGQEPIDATGNFETARLGAGAYLTDLRPTSVARVRLDVPAGSGLCVRSLAIGLPA
jgi:hypothetical protein